MAISVQRCKTAYFAGGARVCDPDISWAEYAWLNAQGAAAGVVYDCDALHDKYFACLASGIPLPPAPAPPPISTDPGQYNDPSLPKQAETATGARFEQWKQIVSSYFGGAVDSNGDPIPEELPGGIPKDWVLYGLAGLAVVAVVLGGRRR